MYLLRVLSVVLNLGAALANSTIPGSGSLRGASPSSGVPTTRTVPSSALRNPPFSYASPWNYTRSTTRQASEGLASLSTTTTTTSQIPEIIIDGSSIYIPTGTQVVSESGNVQLTIGPSGVLESGTILPFPTESEATAVEGFTLEPDGHGSTYATSTTSSTGLSLFPLITPPPSGSPGYIPDTVPTTGRSQAGVAITFDDETYILPLTSSIELLQADGSYLTLLSDAVVSGSATLTVGSVVSQTSLSTDNLHLEAGPEARGSPDTGGASGFGGLVNALKGLAGTARSLSTTLGQIEQQGIKWASGQLTDDAFASGVGSLFDSATSDLSGFVSTMSSTLDDFTSETYEMTEDGLRRVFPARTGGVEQLDLLKTLRKLCQDLTHLRNNAVQQVKNYWKQGTVAAATLAATEEALRNFGTYDWGSETPKSSSSSSSSTSTQSELDITLKKSSSSATTSTSTTTATPTLYMLMTKPGTSQDDFQTLIESLPDGGNGYFKSNFPLVPWQMYVTNLTAEQAKNVAGRPTVGFIYPSKELNVSGFGATIPLQKRVSGNDDLEQRLDSEDHLRLVSASRASHDAISGLPGVQLPNYIFDPTLGEGQTIYILDGGFNVGHTDFSTASGRTVESIVAPNSLTLMDVSDQSLHAPENIDDYNGHGTLVASVAAGVKYGVASRANLVLVKFRNAAENEFNRRTPPKYITRGVTDPALLWAWMAAIEDVKAKRAAGNNGKFIINMSYGFPAVNLDRAAVIQTVLAQCQELDIITTIPTGNDGNNGVSLDQVTPQNLGTPDNAIITVGGVHKDGTLSAITNFDADRGGSITLYGMAVEVTGADFETSSGTKTSTGTSFAAPAVAGLAAYFAALPSLADQWTAGSVGVDMKQFLAKYAYVRVNSPIAAGFATTYRHYTHIPPADSIKVAYNRAPEGLCGAQAPSRRNLFPMDERTRLSLRQDNSSDVNVVVSGVIVASSLVAPFCAASSSKTTSTSAMSTTASSNTAEATTSTTTFSLSLQSSDSTSTESSFTSPLVVSVGTLTGLPTLGPASYCTEVLSDCRQVLHTLTAQSCTYNTVAPSTCSSTSSETAMASSTPNVLPSQTQAAPTPTASCKTSYRVLWDDYSIYGVDWDVSAFGQGDDFGSGLKNYLNGCGGSRFYIQNITDTPPFTWHATGRTVIGKQACIDSAMVSAGSPPVNCGGSA